jgi:SAM-dependent methyltransferase
MQLADYHTRIIDYYNDTENAYKDSWDLDNSLAIHYGYWDEKVNSFSQSLLRMNEIMMTAAGIRQTDEVLDAGCGVGGSSIFLALQKKCRVKGISLSEKQVTTAKANANRKGVTALVDFEIMDYCATSFPDQSFDVVWGCESICYAHSKEQFLREAFRLLKPGGRLVIADGFVSKPEHNEHPVIRQWLDGWAVNYLETPFNFERYMREIGFNAVSYKNISSYTFSSAKRLYRFYYLASLYLLWRKIIFSRDASAIQKKNIKACKYQYAGLRKNLWEYGLIVGQKQSQH